jgi:hypothetical protein
MEWWHEVWAERCGSNKTRANDGPRFMAEQITRLALDGDNARVAR